MFVNSCRECHLNLPTEPCRVESLELFKERKYIRDTEGHWGTSEISYGKADKNSDIFQD